jgi:NAD(P)-dependent dehydrogenase (short-subunit alcohol dehydrogenase family)
MSDTTRRVAIVTGASRGIGAATVDQLLSDGWLVVGADLDASDAPTRDGVRHVDGDVTLESSWDRLVEEAVAMGSLAAVVNNAGVQGTGAPFAETSLEDFITVLGINVTSAFLGTRAALQHGAAGCAVVNIASNAGSRGVPRFGPYVAAKHAVLGLTRTAALEGARVGMRVNAVAPGPTETRIMEEVARSFNLAEPDAAKKKLTAANPSRRFGEPSEIADAIAWLVGPQAGYVNGAVLAVDGGLTAA